MSLRALGLREGVELVKMLDTAVAGRDDEVGVDRVDSSDQRLQRTEAAVVEGALDGAGLQQGVAWCWTDSRDFAACFG